MKKIILMLSLSYPVAISASPASGEWVHAPGWNSAGFALENHELLGTTGLSWPDGRHAVVTLWKMDNNTFRCFDYFDIANRQVNAVCYKAGRN